MHCIEIWIQFTAIHFSVSLIHLKIKKYLLFTILML